MVPLAIDCDARGVRVSKRFATSHDGATRRAATGKMVLRNLYIRDIDYHKSCFLDGVSRRPWGGLDDLVDGPLVDLDGPRAHESASAIATHL